MVVRESLKRHSIGSILDIYFPSVCALRDVGSLPVSEITFIGIEVLKSNVCKAPSTSGYDNKIKISLEILSWTRWWIYIKARKKFRGKHNLET